MFQLIKKIGRNIGQYFKNIWDIQTDMENRKWPVRSRIFPIFMWLLIPLLILATINTWFNLRIFLGTIGWTAIAYLVGHVAIKYAEK